MADAPLIWYTDRSRYSTGTGKCATERYLRYHAGPTGYGLVAKAESLPLVTGKYTHQVLERIFTAIKQEDALPPASFVEGWIRMACDQYELLITARGFRGLLQSERTNEIVEEQRDLIAGLIWAACRFVIPWIHQTYRILEVETERTYMLGCSCGRLATDAPELHAANDCAGVCVQVRQDLLCEHRISGNLAYFEGKTTGSSGDNWAPQWETRPQLAIGTFGIAETYGREVTEHFILALYKGRRDKVEDAFGTYYRQNSPLVYGFCRPGNPPLQEEEWLASYNYTDASGKNRRASKAHEKRPTREYPGGVQQWVADLPDSIVEQSCYLVGPLNRQDHQIAVLKGSIQRHEQEWQAKLWLHYQHPEIPTTNLFPPSYECRRYGERHECEFKSLCFHEAGWEDPIGSGKFVPRRPHHAGELNQAIARGLLPEQAEEEGDEEE